MTGIVSRAAGIVRTDGVRAGVPRVLRLLRLEAQRRYANATGGVRLTAADHEARFGFRTVDEFLSFRYTKTEESAFLRKFVDELHESDIVWDIGANIGVHACLAAHVAESVVAVEPYPPNVERLRENLDRNDISADIITAALADENGTMALSVPETATPGDQWPALVPDSGFETNHSIETPVTTGDTLASRDEIPTPTVLKIDVEGAAYEVLDGLSSVLSHGDCRCVFVEVHLESPVEDSRPAVTDFDHAPNDVRSLLESHGYDVETIEERRADFFLKATA